MLEHHERHLLESILIKLNIITENQKHIMAALDNLKAQVARLETVDARAVALLQGLKSALDAALANDDTAAIQAIADQLGADTDGLAAAVTQNTPAAPDAPTA